MEVCFESNSSTSKSWVVWFVLKPLIKFSCRHGAKTIDLSSTWRMLIRPERKFFINCIKICKSYSVGAKNFLQTCPILLEMTSLNCPLFPGLISILSLFLKRSHMVLLIWSFQLKTISCSFLSCFYLDFCSTFSLLYQA